MTAFLTDVMALAFSRTAAFTLGEEVSTETLTVAMSLLAVTSLVPVTVMLLLAGSSAWAVMQEKAMTPAVKKAIHFLFIYSSSYKINYKSYYKQETVPCQHRTGRREKTEDRYQTSDIQYSRQREGSSAFGARVQGLAGASPLEAPVPPTERAGSKEVM